MRTVLLILALLCAAAVPVIAFEVIGMNDPPAEQIGDMLGLLGLSGAFYIGSHLVGDWP